MAKKMRAVQVAKANGPFDLVERDIPEPQGWPSGTAVDSAYTLAFSAESGVRPIIETMPLERAPEAARARARSL